MLINFNHLKTFSNAFLQKMKSFRGNWNQNDPTADDYIKNRTHYVDNDGNVHKLDKKFIDMPDGIVTEESLYPILEDELAPVAFTNNYNSLSGKPTIYTDVVRYNNIQSLSTSQKTRAKNNINAVGYDTQTLTETQKTQARNNIGAGTSDFSGDYFDLENKPCAKTILADEVILVDYAVPFDEYVYGRSLGKAPLKPTSDYKYRVIIGETTYYPSVTQYLSGSALGNKSLINSTITPEDSGEPFFFTFLPNSTHTFNVEIYYDENVLNTPANVQVIQEMKVEYSLLEDGYIPDTIARTTDIITTCTYSWDGDVTGKESFVIPVNNVNSVPTVTYYKISDKYFNVSDIVSSEVLVASHTPDSNIYEEGFYCAEGVLVADAAGYNSSIGPDYAYPAYIPSPGIYFYTYLPPSSGEQRKGIESATITYKARVIPSDVVGVVRTINGNEPDVDGNIEIPTPVQPNLEQNDETAPDYVKNRTHWSENVTLLEETSFQIDLDNSNVSFTVSNVPKVGDTCFVTCNGTEYICTAIDATTILNAESILLGNYKKLMGTGDSGEPFAITIQPTGEAILGYVGNDGLTTFTLSIAIENIHKIPNKFVPTLEEMRRVVILPTTTEEVDAESGMAMLPAFQLVADELYNISYNSIEYNCKCINVEGMFMLGNYGIEMGTGDTGEPFVIACQNVDGETMCAIMPLDGETSITVSISIIHKLDKKFLPDDIAGGADWNANEGEAGYIKNRTHYDTISEIYPETTMALDSGGAALPSDFILELNKQYIVSWNGTPYTRTTESAMIDGEAAVVVGNLGPLTGSDTGEPFVIIYVPSYNMTLIQAIDESLTSVNLKIEGAVTVKLPYKYLPDNLYHSEIKVLLPESTLTFNNADGDINFMEELLPFELTEGTAYYVFWNGTPYTAIAQLWNATVVIGNVKEFGGSDTGEPFAVFNGDDGTSVICTVDGSTSANVKIEEEKIIKVPEKYLPEINNLPVVSTADNGAFLRVVNGAWAATTLPNIEDGEF